MVESMLNKWATHPRYQRLQQRITRMRPDQRAILSTASADAEFASDAMRKKLWAMNMATQKGFRERDLSLRKRQSDFNYSFGQEVRDSGKKQRRMGTLISAVGIPISGYFGYKQMQRDKEEAELNRKVKEKILDPSYVGKQRLGYEPF
jgi:hypothetical protein